MSLNIVLGFASCIGSLVQATPTHLSLGRSNLLSTIRAYQAPGSPSSLNLGSTNQSNAAVSLPDGPGSNEIHIQCDGASYGFDLDFLDCESANMNFRPSVDQAQWAERHPGMNKQILSLPYRYMGNKASCYFQPVLIGSASPATASPDQVRTAANMLRNKCVLDGKLQGGIATNIGREAPLPKGLGGCVGRG